MEGKVKEVRAGTRSISYPNVAMAGGIVKLHSLLKGEDRKKGVRGKENKIGKDHIRKMLRIYKARAN